MIYTAEISMTKVGEIWKVTNGFENYEVSSYGNVRNKSTQRHLKPAISSGYLHVVLCGNDKPKNLYVHRLVCLNFIANPENKKTVNHKNHNTLDNHVDNLEWATMKEQNRHSRKCSKEIRELCGARAVWRVDVETGTKLEHFKSITFAAQWCVDNKKLTRSSKELAKNISNVLSGRNKTSYGFKWQYDISNETSADGDDEWKDIPCEFVHGTDGYQVSTIGRLKNRKGRISEGSINNAGYLMVSVGKNLYQLHRLVGHTHLPNPDNKPYLNHKDGKKDNPRLDNLEWVTPSENSQHAWTTNLRKRKYENVKL
jgi:hypothetical protein